MSTIRLKWTRNRIAGDGTYPGDRGYLIYTEEVTRFLKSELTGAESALPAAGMY